MIRAKTITAAAGATVVAVALLGTWTATLLRAAPTKKPVPPPAAKPRSAPTGPEDTSVYPTGDLSQTTFTASGAAIVTLSGNAVIRYKDTILRTALATYNDETKVATSPGRVQIEDAQNTVSGDKGVMYYRKRTGEIIGNVKIVARPRPMSANVPANSPRREFKNPVTITCDRVIYNSRTRVAKPVGSLVIRFTFRNKKWTITADDATYDGKTETVTLSRNVRGTGIPPTGKQVDNIRAVETIIVLREGDEDLKTRNVQEGTSFVIEEEEDEDGAAAAQTPPAPTPPAPTPTPPRR